VTGIPGLQVDALRSPRRVGRKILKNLRDMWKLKM
jgi:hypothetical protein